MRMLVKTEELVFDYEREMGRIRDYQAGMMRAASCLVPYSWSSTSLVYHRPKGITLSTWAESQPDRAAILQGAAALAEFSDRLEWFLLEEGNVYPNPSWIYMPSAADETVKAVYVPREKGETVFGHAAGSNPGQGLLEKTAFYLWKRAVRGGWSVENMTIICQLALAQNDREMRRHLETEGGKSEVKRSSGNEATQEREERIRSKEEALKDLLMAQEEEDKEEDNKRRGWLVHLKEAFPFALKD